MKRFIGVLIKRRNWSRCVWLMLGILWIVLFHEDLLSRDPWTLSSFGVPYIGLLVIPPLIMFAHAAYPTTAGFYVIAGLAIAGWTYRSIFDIRKRVACVPLKWSSSDLTSYLAQWAIASVLFLAVLWLLRPRTRPNTGLPLTGAARPQLKP